MTDIIHHKLPVIELFMLDGVTVRGSTTRRGIHDIEVEGALVIHRYTINPGVVIGDDDGGDGDLGALRTRLAHAAANRGIAGAHQSISVERGEYDNHVATLLRSHTPSTTTMREAFNQPDAVAWRDILDHKML